MIIDRGEAEVENRNSECNIYVIIQNFYTWFPFYIKQNRELLNLMNIQN